MTPASRSSRRCGSCLASWPTRAGRVGVRHQLAAVLTITVLTALAGAGNSREAGDQAADLPEAVGRLDGLAIDGKTIRNSAAAGGGADVRLFSALPHHEQVVINQIAVPQHTTEVTCVEDLLDPVDLDGKVVTADAAHTQGDATAAQLPGLIRHHWRVEPNHQVRDVTRREDHQHAYIGTGAQVMAMIRNLALAILRLTGHQQITRTLQRNAAERTRILPILANFPLPA